MKKGIAIIKRLYSAPLERKKREEYGTVSDLIFVAGKYVDMSFFGDAKSNKLWMATNKPRRNKD